MCLAAKCHTWGLAVGDNEGEDYVSSIVSTCYKLCLSGGGHFIIFIHINLAVHILRMSEREEINQRVGKPNTSSTGRPSRIKRNRQTAGLRDVESHECYESYESPQPTITESCGSWGSSKIILAQLRQLLQDLRVAMVSTGKAPSCHLLEQSAAGNGRVPSPLTSSLAGGSAHCPEERSSKIETHQEHSQ